MQIQAYPLSSNKFSIQNLLMLVSAACIAVLFYWSADTKPTQNVATMPIGNSPASGSVTGGDNGSQHVMQLVADAQDFYNLLNSTQKAALQLTYSNSLARKWSNLPCGASCRNGVQFGTLSAVQLAAAYKVIADALGTGANDGFDEFHQTTLAEAYLHAHGGGTGYDSTLRWIAFLNVPSSTGPWMLQFGGHHYAANIAFNQGHVIGATPFFMGLEPKSFSWNNTTYAPLNDEHDAFTSLLASLSTSQLTTAHLSSSFSDCSMIPGETNGGATAFPTTKVGIPCSALNQTQKDLVLGVIQHYVNDMDSATAATVLSVYTSEIDQTYIAYVGNGTSGNASSFLTSQGNYARIDGPTVWIEFSCQGGIVIQGQIHYHTVWRDHSHDYGVNLTGPAIDSTAVTGIADLNAVRLLNVFPNPSNTRVAVQLPYTVKDANLLIVNAATGQLVQQMQHQNGETFQLDIAELPAATYIIRVQSTTGLLTGKIIKP
jgi:hypothetical protein